VPKLSLIHETTAAALAHCQRHPGERRIAVLDFGGGFFDASVIDVRRYALTVSACAGDDLLGGDDFDRRLLDLLVDRFFDQHAVDLGASPTALMRVYEACRTAKHELSDVSRSNAITLPMVAQTDTGPIALEHEGITRPAFEQLVQEELDRLAVPCGWTLEDTGLGTDDLDEVVLTGGMTRSPIVQQALAELYRARPQQLANPGEIVALGAALHAARLRDVSCAPLAIHDVVAHSVGIKVRGGRFSPVIARNRPIPCREGKRFAASKNAGRVTLEIYQGEAELVNDNRYIGRVVVDQRRDHSLDLSFAIDDHGMIEVATVDPSGRAVPIAIQRAGGLDEREIALAMHRPPEPALPAEQVATFASLRDRALAARRTRSRDRLEAVGNAETIGGRGKGLSIKPPPATRVTAAAKGAIVPLAIEVEQDSLIGSVLSDRYIIESIVADGGMGRVYRARHTVLGKTIAVKVLHAELAANDQVAARFVREAQAASSIDNEHVIDISDFGRLPDGTGYFVMEYLDGKTLGALIRQSGVLPTDTIIDIALQISDGLDAAHALGIVHRDLKPDNITIIERRGRSHFCKILDFGIAKSPTSDTNPHATIAGTLLGTPHYMAPEQIDGVDVDARSDIYALGAVLYEMATGSTPFTGDTLVSLLVQHKISIPRPFSEHPAGAKCSPALEAITFACLEKRPEHRPQSAADLAALLRELSR
jgi:tRNA A-37 threonylcarbamoyl transferase component Bud32